MPQPLTWSALQVCTVSNMDEGLTIQEAAERVGLSIDTLRYYERAGLLPHVVRTTGGQRRYDVTNLTGIHFVTKMRATGMPIRRIREYMETPLRPDGTSPERRAILVEHHESMLEKIQELNEAVALIENKIAMYDSNKMGCSPVGTASQQRVVETV
jgi:DNA-binding transcriptional MerR regulator